MSTRVSASQSWVIGAALAGWMVVVLSVAMAVHAWLGRGGAPVQPIQFPHSIHIHKAMLTCDYCHPYTEISPHAGLPGGDLCLGCHQAANNHAPAIQKALRMIGQQGEIPWVRVYRVADHVYFSHRLHVAKSRIACQRCHGPLQYMTVALKMTDLRMGWCLECHHGADTGFYDEPPSHECSTCHK